MYSFITFLLSVADSIKSAGKSIIDFLNSSPWPDWAPDLPEALSWVSDFTIGQLMFGLGLTALLVFIFIKFLLDVVL